MPLSSTASQRISLEYIRKGIAGLNEHRQQMLNRVPESGDWAKFTPNSLTCKDIAYLTAKTNHEFAILRGKTEDILFHGTHYHCEFHDILLDMLINRKLYLYAHTHPDGGPLNASADDRRFLKLINQKQSIVVSAYDGTEKYFSTDLFEL